MRVKMLFLLVTLFSLISQAIAWQVESPILSGSKAKGPLLLMMERMAKDSGGIFLLVESDERGRI